MIQNGCSFVLFPRLRRGNNTQPNWDISNNSFERLGQANSDFGNTAYVKYKSMLRFYLIFAVYRSHDQDRESNTKNRHFVPSAIRIEMSVISYRSCCNICSGFQLCFKLPVSAGDRQSEAVCKCGSFGSCKKNNSMLKSVILQTASTFSNSER